jgi:uncharacterized membrane protein YkvA (DUF1232 family)
MEQHLDHPDCECTASDAEPKGFAKEYSDQSFWDKVLRFARIAGREVIEKALQLYFAAQSADTPAWAKTVIAGALGYFISPVDAVPDVTPIVGFTDDLGVLAAAIAAVIVYITPEVKHKAKEKMNLWFGS